MEVDHPSQPATRAPSPRLRPDDRRPERRHARPGGRQGSDAGEDDVGNGEGVLAGRRPGRPAAWRYESRPGADRSHRRRDAEVANVPKALRYLAMGLACALAATAAMSGQAGRPAPALAPFDVMGKSIEDLQRAMQAG